MASIRSLTAATPEDNTPPSRGLAEPPSSSLPSSSTLSASTPAAPKAKSIAKAKQSALPIHLTHRFRHAESHSLSPASPPCKILPSNSTPTSTPTKPKKYVSSHSIPLPSRKRGGEDLGIGEKPVAKRRDGKQHGKTQAPRAPRAKYDHWSPASSRASSPVRSALIPAEKWYAHLKTSGSMKETETRCKLGVSTSERPASKRQEKAENKEYKSWVEVALGKAGEEDKSECYNCGKKGHWFMDCLSGCGKCNGDGHRTIDCGVVKVHIGLRGAE